MSDAVSVAEISLAIASLQTMHPLSPDIDFQALDSLNRPNRQFLADQITAVLRDPKTNTPADWRVGGVNGIAQIKALNVPRTRSDENASSTSTCLIASSSAFRKLTDLILHQRALKAIGIPQN